MNIVESSKEKLDNEEAGAAAVIFCLAVIPKSAYRSFPLYWLSMTEEQVRAVTDDRLPRALSEILVDPLQEDLWVCRPEKRADWLRHWQEKGFRWFAERQFQPGVTDNLAHTVREGLEMLGFTGIDVASGNGHLFDEETVAREMSSRSNHTGFTSPSQAQSFIELSNRYHTYHPLTDVFAVHDLKRGDEKLLTFPAVHLPRAPQPEVVDLQLSDQELVELSKSRLLALNLEEMKTIARHFESEVVQRARQAKGLPAKPLDVELEILAQTWSEHCKHKIFNATINHTFENLAGKKVETVKSLYKTYIQAPTRKLMEARKHGGSAENGGGDYLLSVFEDNSGVVKFNDRWAVCFKVETHNSPSALEPYGGALTGILGVNRDILGTGLGAKPIFNTDVFCFAYPSDDLPQRPKLLPAETILNGVRKGVEDGGNKSGIPTVNGAIFFDRGYRAKPLVFCGTGGLLPLTVTVMGESGLKGYEKHVRVGDRVVMAGGRVGKDGIHGATFSSEKLHEGSPQSAVQIGDPFTQKRLLDFVIEARDCGLITGITDNGAGGLSSSVGEMARLTGGATIELSEIPKKYPGLTDWEIVVSESQERMTIATRDFPKLKELAAKHKVEVTDIGAFENHGYFEVTNQGKTVAYLELDFLHDGLPPMELEAESHESQITMSTGPMPGDFKAVLLDLLSHPNVCSRKEIIQRYDHEVQGMSVVKPLMGERQMAACDAAVIAPLYGERRGLAIANGLCPRLSEHDAYAMATSAVDEAIRNAVCVGADPQTITLLDNFCWPDPIDSESNPKGKIYLSQLVRACEGLSDAVLAFETPLISGKDSMKNNFDDGTVRLAIPPTLLISAMGIVPDIDECVTMEFKKPSDLIYLLSAGRLGMAGSCYEHMSGWQSSLTPYLDLKSAPRLYRLLHQAIRKGLVASAHDVSEGGLAVCLAESAIGSGFGAQIDLDVLTRTDNENELFVTRVDRLLARPDILLFAEGPARIVVTIAPERKAEFEELFKGGATEAADSSARAMYAATARQIGVVTEAPVLVAHQPAGDGMGARTFIEVELAKLEKAWLKPMPFE